MGIPPQICSRSFNPLPPAKEGVTTGRKKQQVAVEGFNPLPPVKEGVTFLMEGFHTCCGVSILSLQLRRE